ncbi:MAG: hypothetical protein LAT55_03205 [Opitutales bacterium]|nr:hypothetical protein [Opitutales bacterium]
MRFPPTFFAALLFSPVILFAEANPVPQVPTRAEADAAISAEMQAREDREADRKAAIEAVPAFEEWEVDHGNRKTILRRVAPPIPRLRDESQTTNLKSESASPTSDVWTEEEIAAWMAEQPVHRTLNLTATVYDQSFTEITWRDEDRQEWKIVSNIDFRYLGGIGHFDDETHHWMTFLFVYEVDSEKQESIARRATEEGFDYTPRTADHWLSIIPGDFLSSPEPEYIIIAEHEEAAIPAVLYEELDALHRHYHANEERLIADYERNKVMNEARRAYLEANPPKPKDTVINFWRVR